MTPMASLGYSSDLDKFISDTLALDAAPLSREAAVKLLALDFPPPGTSLADLPDAFIELRGRPMVALASMGASPELALALDTWRQSLTHAQIAELARHKTAWPAAIAESAPAEMQGAIAGEVIAALLREPEDLSDPLNTSPRYPRAHDILVEALSMCLSKLRPDDLSGFSGALLAIRALGPQGSPQTSGPHPTFELARSESISSCLTHAAALGAHPAVFRKALDACLAQIAPFSAIEPYPFEGTLFSRILGNEHLGFSYLAARHRQSNTVPTPSWLGCASELLDAGCRIDLADNPEVSPQERIVSAAKLCGFPEIAPALAKLLHIWIPSGLLNLPDDSKELKRALGLPLTMQLALRSGADSPSPVILSFPEAALFQGSHASALALHAHGLPLDYERAFDVARRARAYLIANPSPLPESAGQRAIQSFSMAMSFCEAHIVGAATEMPLDTLKAPAPRL